MPIYEKAPAEVRRVCDRMMKEHHRELVRMGVSVDLYFAVPKVDSFEPALKLHGYPCYATCKVNAPKLRAQGHGDAEIVIDADAWENLDAKSRDALIDHELTHLALRVNKDGEPTFDDYNRPKLGIRLHNHQFGWFDEVARRHGEASVEVNQFNEFQKVQKTLWDPNFDPNVDEAPASIPLGKKRAAAQ